MQGDLLVPGGPRICRRNLEAWLRELTWGGDVFLATSTASGCGAQSASTHYDHVAGIRRGTKESYLLAFADNATAV